MEAAEKKEVVVVGSHQRMGKGVAEDDEDYPSFKSVVFKPEGNVLSSTKLFPTEETGNGSIGKGSSASSSQSSPVKTNTRCSRASKSSTEYFFDSGSKKMVEIDNFSFAQETNHFQHGGSGRETPGNQLDKVSVADSTDSSLALLDSKYLAPPKDPYDLFGFNYNSGSEAGSVLDNSAAAGVQEIVSNNTTADGSISALSTPVKDDMSRKPKILSPHQAPSLASSPNKNTSFSSEDF